MIVDSNIASVDNQLILTLDDATTLTIQQNPNLAQMQARANAMAVIPSHASNLPNPTISFNARNLPSHTFNTAQKNMILIGPGISQLILFPRKLALRCEAANHEAEAALQNVTEARAWLLGNVKQF